MSNENNQTQESTNSQSASLNVNASSWTPSFAQKPIQQDGAQYSQQTNLNPSVQEFQPSLKTQVNQGINQANFQYQNQASQPQIYQPQQQQFEYNNFQSSPAQFPQTQWNNNQYPQQAPPYYPQNSNNIQGQYYGNNQYQQQQYPNYNQNYQGQQYGNQGYYNQQPNQNQNFQKFPKQYNQTNNKNTYQHGNQYQNQNQQQYPNQTYKQKPVQTNYDQQNSFKQTHQTGFEQFESDVNINEKDMQKFKLKNEVLQEKVIIPNTASQVPLTAPSAFKIGDKVFQPYIPKAFIPKPVETQKPVEQVQNVEPVKVVEKPDPFKEQLKSLSITEEAEIKEINDYLKKVKEIKENLDKKDKDKEEKKPILKVEKTARAQGAINLDLFYSVGKLKICETKEKNLEGLKHCINHFMLTREVDQKKDLKFVSRGQKPGRGGYGGQMGKKQYSNNYQNQNYHENKDGDDNDFQKGTAKPYQKQQFQNNNTDQGFFFKPEDTQEKNMLKKQALAVQARISNPKSDIQKIKLIMNVISPDNFDKKVKELRGYLFGDQFKTQDECFHEGIDPELHILKLEDMNNEMIDAIIFNIFRKAQLEKEYNIFYGKLSEELIKTELNLRGLGVKIKSMKESSLRKSLLKYCKDSFDKFFDKGEKEKHLKVFQEKKEKDQMTKEERDKYADDLEKAILFQQKLFGNIEFVGELYRRKLLPEATLVSVFDSLLGIGSYTIDDLVLEGSINLMEKVGRNFEDNINNTKNEEKSKEKKQNLDKILNRFEEIMNIQDDEKSPVSKRIKLLIKNMFADQKSGWQKTKEQNDGGPKTKAEVQKEVKDKHLKEQQARDQRDYGNDRAGYQNEKSNNYDGKNKDNKNQQKYMPKKTDQNQKQKNQPEQFSSVTDKKKNQKDQKNQDKPKQEREIKEIVQIEDEEMGNLLKKNFDHYISIMSLSNEQDPEEETEYEVQKADQVIKKPDYSIYKQLKEENGKKGDQILISLFSKVFDEDTQNVKSHLGKYLLYLYNDKIIDQNGFNLAISTFGGDIISDIVLDCPQIHQYFWENVILPLLDEKVIDFEQIKWETKSQSDKTQAEDDDYHPAPNPLFRLLALIYLDQNQKREKSWSDIVKFHEKWKKTCIEKHKHIEEKDELWQHIEEEVGKDPFRLIHALLNQDSDKNDNQNEINEALAAFK